MANDYSKYDLEFLDRTKNRLTNLSKRRLAFEIIKHLVENNIDTRENINIEKFNTKLIIPSEVQFNGFSANLKGRFYIDSINGERVYISNQWGKPAINKLLAYINKKFENVFKITIYEGQENEADDGEIDGENEEKIIHIISNIDSKMNEKSPLNQIFYGPPGTGKTYNISTEAEKIINKTWKLSSSKNEKFWTICRYLSNVHNYQDKSNSLYKTEKAILWILGYIIKYDDFNITNSINRADAIAKGFDDSSSGWSQQAPFLTDFDFAEYTKSTVALELNESGIKLKNDTINYLSEYNLDPDALIKWEKGKQDTVAPEFIQNAYYEKILKTTEEGFSPTLSTIYSTLNFLLNEPTFPSSQTSWTDASDELRNKTSIYFNPTKPEGDIKWVCQFARVLYGLGLLEKESDNYFLNEKGTKLIEDIVSRWSELKPELFSEKIDYENAVSLGFVEFITFHQSYSYEEFIEGIRPKLDDGDNLSYSLEPGVFKRIADNAKKDLANNYVIIIDEINRGNISKIFGELITLIEPSKRLFSDDLREHPKHVTLPYSKKLFGVPKNLYILGTMNTADKSIALLDSALRRRFSFTEMLPKSSILTKENVKIEGIEIEKLFNKLNQRIEFLIDKDHTIGHSYFLKLKEDQTIEALALLFKKEIIPLLMEYFYGDFEKIQLVLGENKDWKSGRKEKFFKKNQEQQKNLFGKDEVVEGYEEKEMYELGDLLGSNEDGKINGTTDELVDLFKSVYTPQSK